MFTFLFTDIEGSTRLWEEFPEAMRVALARHDLLLRQAIEGAGGEVFKTVGDAFCAAFAAADGALGAAVAAQRALAGERWEGLGRPLKVRMAVHAGTAERRGGDYFGQALNRIARLMKAAHGGQVLLSEAAFEPLRQSLPPGADLRDLGEHLLKDLARPEHVYQLVHPDLPSEFPPLRSLEAFTHNLPVQLTSFIGRDREVAVVKQRLASERLLTLIGAGGSGKTRLMLQVGADVIDQFEHGVWLAELAPLSDPGLVVQTVADALGVREEAGKTLLAALTDYLRTREALLILDNCEHVVAACAAFVSRVLAACPAVRILASSREPLGVQGEGVYTVPPLSVPSVSGLLPPPEELLGSPAVRLFVDRATHSQPAFQLTGANSLAVAQICNRLDGIPLAIELAAARVRILSAEQIATRLSDRFRLLTGGDRAALPRQQTLRALIDWSYDLLGDQERRLFARLSVFAGGWTLESAEQIASDDSIEEWEVLDLMSHLVDKSLVVPEESGETGETRYRLLQTMRHYAQERLREFGEEEAFPARHRDYFLSLAERAEAGLLGAEQKQWLDRLEAEYDNLRAALECASETDPEAGLRAVAALWRFWSVRAFFTEGRAWLGRFLEATGGAAGGDGGPATTERAKVFRAAGALASNQGDSNAAQQLLSEGLRIFEELGDRRGAAGALNSMGNVAWRHGEFAEARALYERSLGLAREMDDRRAVAVALISLGNVACQQGDYAASQSHYEEALTATRAIGNREWEAANLQNLGDVLWLQGESEKAGALYEQSLALRRELGDRRGVAASLGNLGNVASHHGDFAGARRLHEEALAMNRASGDRQWEAISLGNLGDLDRTEGECDSACLRHREALAIRADLNDRWGIAQSIACLAQAACAAGRSRWAARLFGAAEAQREAIGAAIAPIEQQEYDRLVARAREDLGEEAFAALWAEGRGLTVEGAVAEALAGD